MNVVNVSMPIQKNCREKVKSIGSFIRPKNIRNFVVRFLHANAIREMYHKQPYTHDSFLVTLRKNASMFGTNVYIVVAQIRTQTRLDLDVDSGIVRCISLCRCNLQSSL